MVNGCIGPCNGWDPTRGKPRQHSRDTLLRGSVGAGNAAGWEWWIRIFFLTLDHPYRWDLLFVSIAGATEVVELLQKMHKDLDVKIGDD